ncbi:Replicative DNA helicase [Candidatus Vidania fulgoroideae]|uniref:DNA 5'-3' helicase n=1 Tax=Candidatus Vidania fulgoroideorum TaxID=881286 RepID=A0A346E0K1_9PROT|nr:Replicative DNA helicase [Candidatus Vidania fulgoroideae]
MFKVSIFFSEDIEKVLIGNILLENKIFFKVYEKIKCKDFFFKKNQLIFEKIKKLLFSNIKVDPIVLLENINNKKFINIKYINSMINMAYKRRNIKFYTNIIKQKSLQRKFFIFIEKIKNETKKKPFKKIVNIIYKKLDNFFIKEVKSKTLKKKFKEYFNKYKKNYKNILTGYTKLDKLTMGLHRGELVIVAGRPSTGKTAFVINICENISINLINKKNLQSVIFTMEMSSEQILVRLLSSILNINSCKIIKKNIKKEKILKTKKKILKSKIIMDDSSNLTPEKLKIRIKNIINRKKIDVVIIDYLQLMNIDEYKENRTNEVSKISRSLKNIAKEFNISIIAVSQLNRNSEQRYDKIPILSDLRESGSIEQDADLIILMYNNNYNEDETKFIVAKNRNGPTGIFKLKFIKKITKFKNL